MTGPFEIWTVVKNAGPILRNLPAAWSAASNATQRALADAQTRKLAERFDVAPQVIDTLVGQEMAIRSSATHGIRLELKEPITASWAGERIRGSLYVTVRNEWVHPATLTKLVAKLETSGYKSLIDVSKFETDHIIPGMTGHTVELDWSWLTNPDHLRNSTIRDDRLSEAALSVTPTASITWEGIKFTVETPFYPTVLVSPRNSQSAI